MRKLKIILVLLCFVCLFALPAEAEEELIWDNCVAEAAKNNPDLILAQENVVQQKALKAITVSQFYPQITAEAGAATQKTSTTSSVSGDVSQATKDSYSYGVTGTLLLFDGFKTNAGRKAALENIKAAQQNYRFASSQVRLNLRTAFINLLKAQELIRVAQEIVKIRKDNLELISLRYESGLEHKGALLTAKANFAQAEFELSQARRDVALAQRQLTKEMGRKVFGPLSVKGSFVVRDTAELKPDFEMLVKANPFLGKITAKKNAAFFDLKSADAESLPKVSATSGAHRSSSDWPPENDEWNIGVNVSVPVFEGGLRRSRVQSAKAAYKQAQAGERSTKDSVIVALEQKWVSLQDAVESLKAQKEMLVAAQERADIAETQYSTGFITFDNWIIIENDLVKAKKTYLEAQANALYAEAEWIQAKGETLEYAQ
ncbi:MAG: TolC family protein [Candidatus Omnitrophica bacterium]|nr:TolC family protein [Candidatus Omnitrophota bacterium]MBU4478610.1 TolC family protein [Candidatus Omnitrophota bacterium]